MSDPYNPIVQETVKDIQVLAENNYRLQVAKSVSYPGAKAVFNVVYVSLPLAPEMSIVWTAKYALNFTTQIPASGSPATFEGEWQPCEIGQSYDLDGTGMWVANEKNPNADKNSLNIGSNGFGPLNVVIGTLGGDEHYMPIYVNPTKLLKNGFGSYQPKQSVQLWFQDGEFASTMISKSQSTPVEEFDMSQAQKHYFRYDADKGIWLNQNTPFDEEQGKE